MLMVTSQKYWGHSIIIGEGATRKRLHFLRQRMQVAEHQASVASPVSGSESSAILKRVTRHDLAAVGRSSYA